MFQSKIASKRNASISADAKIYVIIPGYQLSAYAAFMAAVVGGLQ